MFTLKEKIVQTLSEIKTLESSLDYADKRDLPNVYHNNILLQLSIKEDILQYYLEQIPTKAEVVKSNLLYSLENL